MEGARQRAGGEGTPNKKKTPSGNDGVSFGKQSKTYKNCCAKFWNFLEYLKKTYIFFKF
jgi:hypothetical protein